ncbi:hypothetical protein BDY21DRAFT_111077 [Lineolata rhizophorae]|uniref:Uncharacterized protein n=1 Tax=Lineolata rhizophorae TaxID=578093 RepID=A0A6A6NRB3_9PEZI|nr:hypothetical protein BDY21DRAFT_111077 [Lineolata rhizophorae]
MCFDKKRLAADATQIHIFWPVTMTSTDFTRDTAPAAAMTAVYTPPPSCDTMGPSAFNDEDCMPTAWSQYWWEDIGYYSPAICPSGYTSACPRPTTSNDVGGLMGPSLIPSESAIICCPSDYACNQTYQSMCVSGTTSGYAIQVRWQQTDLAALETDPLSPGVTPTPSTSSSQSSSIVSTTSSTSASGSSSSGGGMSDGAKVGVGIAVPLGVLALGLVGAFFWWRRRKQKKATAAATGAPFNATPGPHSTGAPYPEVAQYASPQQQQQQQQQQQGVYPQQGYPQQGYQYQQPYVQVPQQMDPSAYYGGAASTAKSPSSVAPTLLSNPAPYAPQPEPPKQEAYEAPGNDTYISPPTVAGGGAAAGSAASETSSIRNEPDPELARIRLEQQRLQERKSRLTQLHALEEEEQRLQRQLDARHAELGGGGSGAGAGDATSPSVA